MRSGRKFFAVMLVALAASLALGTGIAGARGGTGGGGSTSGGTTSGGGGGGSTTGGGGTATGGGGGGKVVCVPLATKAATAGYVPGAMRATATYSLDPCTSRGTVTVDFVNTTTGLIEYTLVDPGQDLTTGLNTMTWDNAQFATTYRVDFTVRDKKNGGLYQKASVNVLTPDAVANCAAITKNNLTSGYWGVYAAIWESYTATNCGYGRQHVELRITNLNTGSVVYDAPWWGMDGLLDYEGPVVAYNTPYQFDVEVHGSFGELLDSQSQTIWSAP